MTLLLVLICFVLIYVAVVLTAVFYLPFLEKKRIKDYENYKKFVDYNENLTNK